MEEEKIQLVQLIPQVYDRWCEETGNPGGVRLNELQSAAAMMGDLHTNGRLIVSRQEAEATLRQLLDDLNEKSLYAQSRSFLPTATKGMPNWVKWLILALGVVLLAVGALFANAVTADTMAEQGVSEAASFSIA